MSNAPYVISADLETVSQDYLMAAGIDDFRASLTGDLEAMGKTVEWVDYVRIQAGLRQLLGNSNLSVISLDDRYVEGADHFLGISRSVNEQLEDAGYDSRIGHASVLEQLDRAAQLFGGEEVVLVDDVVFTGENACWLSDELLARGVKVSAIICGVAIGDAEERLASNGLELAYVELFPEVEDEICERDFAFVQGSGRKVKGLQQSALYFDSQYGKPDQWASINPEKVEEFCVASIRRNCSLIKGDYPMGQIADFLGYDGDVSVAESLDRALANRQTTVQ